MEKKLCVDFGSFFFRVWRTKIFWGKFWRKKFVEKFGEKKSWKILKKNWREKIEENFWKKSAMELEEFSFEQKIPENHAAVRPRDFAEFVGQDQIVAVLKTAIESAKKRQAPLGHALFAGPSGFGKTSLAQLVAKSLDSPCKMVTAYAFTKPADVLSLLNNLEEGTVLFIDEMHRLKPQLEEILYVAMEDFCVDVVLGEDATRVPIAPFTLVAATTKPESLAPAMKNRFTYHFHFSEYGLEDVQKILAGIFRRLGVSLADAELLAEIARFVAPVPREMLHLGVKIRDFLVANGLENLDAKIRELVIQHGELVEGGLNPLQQRYLEILEKSERPLSVKTLAVQLGLETGAIESDVEPLLLKLGLVEKTSQGRKLRRLEIGE